MFDIRVDEPGVVRLFGRLDANQEDKAEAVFSTVTDSVTVDLAGLDYIASAGLSVLLRAYKRLAPAGKTIRLVNVPPRVATVLRLAGFDTFLQIA